MTKGSRFGHIWRWQDEDPEAIVLLVLFIVIIVAIPWRGCGLSATQGEEHSVTDVAAREARLGVQEFREQQATAHRAASEKPQEDGTTAPEKTGEKATPKPVKPPQRIRPVGNRPGGRGLHKPGGERPAPGDAALPRSGKKPLDLRRLPPSGAKLPKDGRRPKPLQPATP